MFFVIVASSGVARVIVLGGGQVASGEGILEGPPPQLLHGFRLLEWSWTQLGAVAPPLPPNYATGYEQNQWQCTEGTVICLYVN